MGFALGRKLGNEDAEECRALCGANRRCRGAAGALLSSLAPSAYPAGELVLGVLVSLYRALSFTRARHVYGRAPAADSLCRMVKSGSGLGLRCCEAYSRQVDFGFRTTASSGVWTRRLFAESYVSDPTREATDAAALWLCPARLAGVRTGQCRPMAAAMFLSQIFDSDEKQKAAESLAEDRILYLSILQLCVADPCQPNHLAESQTPSKSGHQRSWVAVGIVVAAEVPSAGSGVG